MLDAQRLTLPARGMLRALMAGYLKRLLELARRVPDREHRPEAAGGAAAARLHGQDRAERLRDRRDAGDVRDLRQHRVRFGIIESFLRYYFVDKDPAARDALVRRSVLFLIATTTVACIVLAIPAGPLSRLITSEHVPGSFRVAVLGIWSFTNLELAQAVLRVDERLKAYAIAGTINVVVTVAASVVLVVGLDKGYNGLLIANYGTRRSCCSGSGGTCAGGCCPAAADPTESFRTLFRFGLPTVPAEASVYALSVLDRQYIVHQPGRRRGGALRDRDQGRGRDRVHRHGLPVRLAAAGLLGHTTTRRRRACTRW